MGRTFKEWADPAIFRQMQQRHPRITEYTQLLDLRLIEPRFEMVYPENSLRIWDGKITMTGKVPQVDFNWEAVTAEAWRTTGGLWQILAYLDNKDTVLWLL